MLGKYIQNDKHTLKNLGASTLLFPILKVENSEKAENWSQGRLSLVPLGPCQHPAI